MQSGNHLEKPSRIRQPAVCVQEWEVQCANFFSHWVHIAACAHITLKGRNPFSKIPFFFHDGRNNLTDISFFLNRKVSYLIVVLRVESLSLKCEFFVKESQAISTHLDFESGQFSTNTRKYEALGAAPGTRPLLAGFSRADPRTCRCRCCRGRRSRSSPRTRTRSPRTRSARPCSRRRCRTWPVNNVR